MEIVNLLFFLVFAWMAYMSFHLSQKVYRDYFAPLGLLWGINLASLSLYHLGLLPLTSISIQAYALIAIALFSFLWGAIAASSLGMPRKRASAQGARPFDKNKGLVLFYYLTAGIFFTGWIYYMTGIVPPGWWTRPWVLQNQIVPHHMGYTLVLGALIPPTFTLLALLRRRVTLPSLLVFLAGVSALAMIGIKSYLVIGISTALLTWALIRPGRVSVKHLMIISIALIGFMVLYNSMIDIFVSYRLPGSKFPDTLSFLERPYIYIVGPWAAMTEVMASPPIPDHWGQATLQVIWKILGPGGLKIMAERVPQNLPNVNIGASFFNTYSLIGELYWDWGFLGTILGCLLLGFISTILYIVAQRRSDWVLYLLSAVFSYGILISFFVFYYRGNLVFLFLYTFIMGKTVKKIPSVCLHFSLKVLGIKRGQGISTA